MAEWFQQYGHVLAWTGAISVLAFVATLIAIPFLVARIPQNYFMTKTQPQYSGARYWLFMGGKNLLGIFLLTAGILMLVLPGQGILTIVLGLSLLNFPRKRRFIRWLVSKPLVYRPLDWLRRKTHSPPLKLPRRPNRACHSN